MSLNLDYFYGDEAEQYSFYRIPKTLFTDPNYSSMSMEARVLYGLMLDRMSLSVRNGWLDSSKRVYIYFTLEDAISLMGFGHNKAVRHFKELEDIGLIERKKQGQGRPTRIYVNNFIPPDADSQAVVPAPASPPETSQKRKSEPICAVELHAETSEIGKSALPQKGSQDFPKTNANNTEKNNTEFNDTESIYPPSAPAPRKRCHFERQTEQDRIDQMEQCREQIKSNIDYDHLIQERPFSADLIDGYVELMLEVFCSDRPSFRICGDSVPTSVVQGRFLKLTYEHITYVLDCMAKNTTLIGNIKAYTLAALYNAPITMGQYYAALVSHDMAQPDF